MGRAEAGSTKAIANSIKAKGLGRLRWYCQICEKQCRDENGFQAHTRSEPHMRKMLLIGPKAGQTIAEFSNQFQKEFVALLRTRHQTVRVRANAVYNEYIQDKDHIHMNATRWVTLSGFVMTLGKAGIVKVDEDEKGLWITWIDNSPKTLAKQAALQKRDRATMDGEERERAELQAQIERARAKESEKTQVDANLQKKDGEKISLSLFPTVSATTTSDDTSQAGPSPSSPPNDENKSGITSGTIGVKAATAPTAITVNPLKRPAPVNVFKTAKVAKTDTASESGSSKKAYASEAERLMKEDQARKAMRAGGGGGGGYQGAGPRRTGDGGRRFVLQ